MKTLFISCRTRHVGRRRGERRAVSCRPPTRDDTSTPEVSCRARRKRRHGSERPSYDRWRGMIGRPSSYHAASVTPGDAATSGPLATADTP